MRNAADWRAAYAATRIGMGLTLIVSCWPVLNWLFGINGLFVHRMPLAFSHEPYASQIPFGLLKLVYGTGVIAGFALTLGFLTRLAAGVAVAICLMSLNVWMAAICVALIGLYRYNMLAVDNLEAATPVTTEQPQPD